MGHSLQSLISKVNALKFKFNPLRRIISDFPNLIWLTSKSSHKIAFFPPKKKLGENSQHAPKNGPTSELAVMSKFHFLKANLPRRGGGWGQKSLPQFTPMPPPHLKNPWGYPWWVSIKMEQTQREGISALQTAYCMSANSSILDNLSPVTPVFNTNCYFPDCCYKFCSYINKIIEIFGLPPPSRQTRKKYPDPLKPNLT